jgi:hypothetical protein
MRLWLVVLLAMMACSDDRTPVREQPREPEREVSLDDLRFSDEPLQAIANRLVAEARRRGIQTSSGRTRIDRLLRLEAFLGGTLAQTRVNRLAAQLVLNDVSDWATLRQQAERDFARGSDETSVRVRDLLVRWRRRKAEIAYTFLSSNYRQRFISSDGWEQRFHEFVSERPYDAATWGWLLLRAHAGDARAQYGRADSETAYRFYLEFAGLGDGREARRVFSVPGVQVAAGR